MDAYSEFLRLLGSPGAGLSALADAPQTVGLSALAVDPLGDATAALEARRRQQVEGARAPAWMRDIGANIGNLAEQSPAAFIPPELRDWLPSAGGLANLVLGSLPGSGDYMAARDAMNASVAGMSALGQGDYMRAGARGIDALTAALGVMPFIPYLASIKGVGDAIPHHLRPGVEPPTQHNPRGLPMDEASRMRRAKEMGFTIDAYHGSPRERFQSFDPEEYGAMSGSNAGTDAGAWFTSDRSVADAYRSHGLRQEQGKFYDRRGGHVLEAKLRLPDAETFDVLAEGRRVADEIGIPNADRISAQEASDLLGGVVRTDMVDDAMAAGRSGFAIHNSVDDPGALLGRDPYPSTHYVVFDPRNIRSRNATFDPERAGSSDLLASIAPWLAALGGGAGLSALYLDGEEGGGM
jgi:hypothetical protein